MSLPILISEKLGSALLEYDQRVDNLIPHAKKVKRQGKNYLVVNAGRDELQILRNLGYEPPSPITIDYDWCGVQPYHSQVVTADMLIHNSRAYVLNDLGTGKTLSALFAFDYLKKHKLANKALVVAPLSTTTAVWEHEVFMRMPHLSTECLWSSSQQKRLDALKRDADIYVINHDGIKIQSIFNALMDRRDIDVIIIDELACFRNKQTNRWQHMNKLVAGRKFAWGLTGAPTPNEPLDAWAQIRLLTPSRVSPYKSVFRDETMVQVSTFKWIPKKDANDVVFSYMKPSVRFSRAQCIDLPETTYSSRNVQMTPEQAKVYTRMRSAYAAQYNAKSITAANAGVMTSKLIQVATGWVYGDDHGVIELPNTPRMHEVEAIIEESNSKLIIFASYTAMVDKMTAYLLKKGVDVAKIYGDTPKLERDMIFAKFQSSNKYKAIVAHPTTMAHGLTLTAADTIVWLSVPPSPEIYEQANARITRPGQVNHTHIIHIEGSAIERTAYARVRNKLDIQGALLDMFQEETGNYAEERGL